MHCIYNVIYWKQKTSVERNGKGYYWWFGEEGFIVEQARKNCVLEKAQDRQEGKDFSKGWIQAQEGYFQTFQEERWKDQEEQKVSNKKQKTKMLRKQFHR